MGRSVITGDNIRLNKKITSPMMLTQIRIYAEDNEVTETQACYDILKEACRVASEKRNSQQKRLGAS